MKRKYNLKSKYQFIIFICFLVFVLYIYNIEIVITEQICNNIKIGIIDGERSIIDERIVSNRLNVIKNDDYHGDAMIEFGLKYSPKAQIYYFDAKNNEGIIDTNSIIDGLNWMIENNVDIVNISLSTSKYSEELELFIKEHISNITIFASYNNLVESNDYPAMYEGVIGVGKASEIKFKSLDISYKSSKIILKNNFLKIYNGNSYLALMESIILSDKNYNR